MTAKVLNLERYASTGIKSLMFAAALLLSIPYSCGPPTLLSSVPPIIGVTVMANKPRSKLPKEEQSGIYDALGNETPLSHFGNERPFNPDVDTSRDKELGKRIARVMEEERNKHKKEKED